MQRSKKRKLNSPKGRCYELSCKFVLANDEAVLVHGRVWSAFFGRMIDHAWVEIPAGVTIDDDYGDHETLDEVAVLDRTLKKKLRLMPKHLYFAIAKPEPIATYSSRETLRYVLRFKTWGPWPDGGCQ